MIYPFKVVIFHSYVQVREGTSTKFQGQQSLSVCLCACVCVCVKRMCPNRDSISGFHVMEIDRSSSRLDMYPTISYKVFLPPTTMDSDTFNYI